MKEWSELGPQQKRAKTQKIYDEIKKTAEERNVAPEKMVGGLLRR